MFFHRKVGGDFVGDGAAGENQSAASENILARDGRSVLSFLSHELGATQHSALAAEVEDNAARDAANDAIESVHRLVSSLYALGERSVGQLHLPQGVVNDIREHTAGVDTAFSRIKPIVRSLALENEYYAFGQQRNGDGAVSVTSNDNGEDNDKTLIERTLAVSRLLDGMTSIVQSVIGDASTWNSDVECAYATLAELLGLACDEIRRVDDEYLAGRLARSPVDMFVWGGSSTHDGSACGVSIPRRQRGIDSSNETISEGNGSGVKEKTRNTRDRDNGSDEGNDGGSYDCNREHSEDESKKKVWRPSTSIIRTWSHARQGEKLLALGIGDQDHEESGQETDSPSASPNNSQPTHAQHNQMRRQGQIEKDGHNLIELFRELADLVLRSVEWPRPPPPPSARGSQRLGGGKTSAYRDTDDYGAKSGEGDRSNKTGGREKGSFEKRMGSFNTASGNKIRCSRSISSQKAKKSHSDSSPESNSEEEDGDREMHVVHYPFVLLEDGCVLERAVRGGRNDLVMAQTLFLVGEVLVKMGEFDGALDHYNECLRIRKLRLGDENSLVAEVHKSIGNVYNLTSRPIEADACYIEALRSLHTRRRSNSDIDQSENNGALLVSILRLRGHIKAAAGETEEAISILCWCLDNQRSALGKDHPDVADVLWTRASLYLDVCRGESATADFWEALRIRKLAYGNEDPVVGDTLQDLGMITWKRGDAEQAIELLSDALWVRRQACGETDDENREARLKEAETQALLAVIYRKSGRVDSAIQMYEGCLELRKTELGDEDGKVADVHVALGHAYSDQKMYSEARRNFLAGMTILEKISKQSDSRFLQLVYLLGRTEFKDGRASSAKKYLERFVRLRNVHGYYREIDYVKAKCILQKLSGRAGD